MPFLFLLFLTLACLPESWPAPWVGFSSPWISAALTWPGVASVAVFAYGITARMRRLLTQNPQGRDTIVNRYGNWRRYHLLSVCGMYVFVLYVADWGWAVQSYCGAGLKQLPGAELLTLAPLIVALFLSRVCFYDVEHALHALAPHDGDRSPFWSRWAYLLFHIRQNLALILVPILLLITMKSLPRLFPEAQGDGQLLLSGLGLLTALMVFAIMPWVLRIILGLRSLPDGPLRDRLLATACRLHFRCSNILLWDTRNGVANAMVAGIVPSIRYVLLTDRLISELTPEEVEAVFGHEVGHIKHHHMLYYLSFLMLSLTVLWLMWAGLATALHLPRRPELEALPLVLGLGAYIFVVFGFLSRRCERQADIFGCRAVSCARADCAGHWDGSTFATGCDLCPTGIHIFINALEKVALLNGINRDRPGWLQSWQHSTIARRVEFLQRMLGDPSLEPRFQRRVALVKWGLLLALAGVLLALLVFTDDSFSEHSESPPPITSVVEPSSRFLENANPTDVRLMGR